MLASEHGVSFQHAVQMLNADTVTPSSICDLHAVQMLGPKSPSLLLLALDKILSFDATGTKPMSCVSPQLDAVCGPSADRSLFRRREDCKLIHRPGVGAADRQPYVTT